MERRVISRLSSAAGRLGRESCRRGLLLYILLHVSCHIRESIAVRNAHTAKYSSVPRDATGAAEKTKALRQVL